MIGLMARFFRLAAHFFSAFCRNWFSVTKEKRNPLLPELPWLVLTDDDSTGKRKLSFRLGDWAELPRDMIRLMASFFCLAAHRFSAFCRNWFSVTKEKRNPLLPELPWLVLTDDDSTGKRKLSFRMADWAELPRDMVELVASFLPVVDRHRFSAVCQSWFSATKEKQYPLPPELPWLVLTDDESTGKRRLFNMSENKHYHLDIPELRGAFIVGSSFGWLFAVGPKLDAYLVNPFSGSKFYLPSLPIYSNIFRPGIQVVQRELVMKAVLSSDPSRCTNFVVFIALHGCYTLAFYKPGDTTWTIIDYEDDIYDEDLIDIICFKGRLYALHYDSMLATVDIGPEPKIKLHKKLVHPYDDNWLSYLVDDYNNKSLLLVVQLQEKDKDDHNHYVTTGLRVFKVDLESYNTCEVEHIDGHALFLGRNDSTVVRASDFNDHMANNLYFFDETFGFPGVFNLSDGSIRHFEIYHPPQPCPIWLVPNMVEFSGKHPTFVDFGQFEREKEREEEQKRKKDEENAEYLYLDLFYNEENIE